MSYKFKPILHIIARDLETEKHIRQAFKEAREKYPDFMMDYSVVFSYKGEVDIKLVELAPEKKKYEYKLSFSMLSELWKERNQLNELQELGRDGWKVVGITDYGYILLMREVK